MTRTYSLLLMGLVLMCATGCVRMRERGIVFSMPADSSQVADLEDALADEQEQRMDADQALRVHSDESDIRLGSTLAATQGMDPVEAAALVDREIKTLKNSMVSNQATQTDKNGKQFEALAAMIQKNQDERGGDDQWMLWLLGALGVTGAGGAGLMGRMHGRNVERDKNGKTPA